jgi:RNA polymerase sigma-70 factor (ECF subfamily)
VQRKRDEDLLAAHMAGDPEAFETLVSRYMRELYAFLSRFVGNATAAEDIIQDTFVQVHLAASSFDPARAFKPWLYTIAANKARDYMRARGRRQEYSLDRTGPDEDGPAPAKLLGSDQTSEPEQAESRDERAAVREVVNRMPEHLRLILVLGYFQQLPYAEIAEVLEIPVGTVKSRLHAAVQYFGRLWKNRAEI